MKTEQTSENILIEQGVWVLCIPEKNMKKSIQICFYIVFRSLLTELLSSLLRTWLMEERIILYALTFNFLLI